MRMFFITVVLALVVLAPALAAAEESRPSQVACDATKIGARDLAECLRAGADRADRELAATVEAAIKSVDTRQGLLSSQKARWSSAPSWRALTSTICVWRSTTTR